MSDKPKRPEPRVRIPAPKNRRGGISGPINRDRAGDAASALFSAFPWTDAPEGGDFWRGVYERLRQIAQRGA